MNEHAPLTQYQLESREPPQGRFGEQTNGRTDERTNRLFLHVDMDAFFVSVELRDNPSLKGLPVAVGGGSGERGVVTTASYEARKFGVKAGMPSRQALKLCPQLIGLPVNGRKYVHQSALIMDALESISPDVKPLSVDEASLDITGVIHLHGSPETVGIATKNLIRDRFDLPCTVGIGPNRLVAKVAAGLGKPDGLLFIPEGSARAVFENLPVQEMLGIGPATAAALESLGIRTLGRLADTPDEVLKRRFGIMGPELRRMARGEWSGRMVQYEAGTREKSIGHSRTFMTNITDRSELRGKLVALGEMVCRRAREAGLKGRTLTLTIRYSDFHTITHQTVLPVITHNEDELILTTWHLLDEVLEPGRPVRLLGVSLGRLKFEYEVIPQTDMFHPYIMEEREQRLYTALDNLRDRFGERVIARAMGGRFKPKRALSMSDSISEIVGRRRS